MHWFIDPIKNHYVDFKGRATRKEYWMFMLIYTLITLFAAGLAISVPFISPLEATTFEDPYNLMMPFFITFGLFCIFILAITLPVIALQIRRLHDIGCSAWWYALAFIPYIGGIIIMIMSCFPSEVGINRWGENRYGIGVPQIPTVPEETPAEADPLPVVSQSTPSQLS
jgi:uncharacterized membrane protein YhaH (DUF805 family)